MSVLFSCLLRVAWALSYVLYIYLEKCIFLIFDTSSIHIVNNVYTHTLLVVHISLQIYYLYSYTQSIFSSCEKERRSIKKNVQMKRTEARKAKKMSSGALHRAHENE